MTNELRPAVGTVVGENEAYRETVTRVDETADKLVVRTRVVYKDEFYQSTSRSYQPKDRNGIITHQKFACVNGPRAGEKHVPEEVEHEGYVVFNRSTRWRRRNDPVPTCVLVHITENR